MTAITSLFPVQLHTQWCKPSSIEIEPIIADWLLDPDSLTARLKSHCRNFQVKVLGQKIEPCSQEDACEIIRSGSQVLVREVILYCDDSPQVFARSLLPITSLTGEEKALADLGEQPLGQVIFSRPNLVRTAIEVGQFDKNSTVAGLAKTLNSQPKGNLWGRRSLFHLDKKPLVVAEVFLPNALAYRFKEQA
jgi:chorismate lyase